MFKFFKNTGKRLKQATTNLFHILLPSKIDAKSLQSLEDTLFSADIGVDVTKDIVSQVKDELSNKKSMSREDISSLAADVIRKNLSGSEGKLSLSNDGLTVICLIGTNGSGKTTTAAKLAYHYKNLGYKVLLGSCDTFRAAANEQLVHWAQTLSIDIVESRHGGDSAAVAFDSYQSAIARKKNLLILDTAGRLHTKTNLIVELEKILRVLRKKNQDLPLHVWLVADSTIGSNTIKVSQSFNDNIPLTGLIMTKLDGTSTGGTLIGTYSSVHVPIFFIGTGEQCTDLHTFSIEQYLSKLLPY